MFHNSITCCYLYVISKYGYPPPAENTAQHLEEMKTLGFRCVELEGIRQDHLLTVHEMRFVIKEKIKDLGLTVPYFCVVLPGLSSADKKERERNISLFEKGCEIAKVLEAKGVLDNGPLPPYRFPEDIPTVRHFDEDVLQSASLAANLNWNSYWESLVDTYRQACDIAASQELTYLMHPCLGVLSATTDAFLYFHDAVGRDNLRFNFDTANQFVMKENLAISLHRIAEYIDYIHLSDNRGLKVEHLVPGNGVIKWDVFFETLDFIGFKGQIGLDIGGDESDVENLEQAYIQAAKWLERRWKNSR